MVAGEQAAGGGVVGFRAVQERIQRRHEWVAECFYADSSDHSPSAFYMEAFALPLFVPSEHLYFDYGARVGRRWDGVTDDLLAAVQARLPALHRQATLGGLLANARDPDINIRHAEIHLCVALIRGDEKRFHTVTRKIATWEVRAAWEPSIVDRCIELAQRVRAEGDQAGIRTLRERAPGVFALFA